MTAAGSIRRVRGREAFRRLARDGRRVRRRALWCSWCPEPSPSPPSPTHVSVAFALGRALGPAVVRNRLRRRLRAICRSMTTTGELPPGMLLIGATPAVIELTYAQLETELRELLRVATTPTAMTATPLSRPDAPSD